MKALYRRYRPKTLSEVVGQEQITGILQNSLKNGKLAHAYLFIGPRGTGKTSVARILAHTAAFVHKRTAAGTAVGLVSKKA